MEGNQTEINYKEKYESLKLEHDNLLIKHKELEGNFNNYKFDIEFNKELLDSGITANDDQIQVLKELKASGNTKAYEVMLSSLQGTPMNTGSLFNRSSLHRYITSKNEDKTEVEVDDFTQAINEMKGVK